MAAPEFRFPVWRRFVGEEAVYEWIIPLNIETSGQGVAQIAFLFDSGTQLTTIPFWLAERHGIPFHRQRPVTIRGSTGSGQGFVAPMWFSLVGLPEYRFRSLCCFTDSRREQGLLSLKDVIRHFRMRTLLPSPLHPLGSLLLRLHGRHKGERRPR